MDKVKTGKIISAVAMILIGLFLVISPLGMLAKAIRIIGWVMGLIGIVCGAIYLFAHVRIFPLLVTTIIMLMLGILFISKPYTIISKLPLFAGIPVIIWGIGYLFTAYELKQGGAPRGTAGIVAAVLTIFLGILIIANPFSTMSTLVRVIGIIVIYNGISSLMTVE